MTKRQLDGLDYRKAQKRNSEKFHSLSKAERVQVREQGYKNLGWDNVCKSWSILLSIIHPSPINLIEFNRKKAEDKYRQAEQTGDLLEVLEAGKNVIQSLKLKYQ